MYAVVYLLYKLYLVQCTLHSVAARHQLIMAWGPNKNMIEPNRGVARGNRENVPPIP